LSSIVLIRHGPVTLTAPALLTRTDFFAYVDAYERSSLRADTRPPDVPLRRVRDAREIFVSPALRAVESLKLLESKRVAIFDPIFAEEPHSVPHLRGRWPLLVWFMLTRGNGAFHPAEAETGLSQVFGGLRNLEGLGKIAPTINGACRDPECHCRDIETPIEE
jgi:hypothetical protein